MTKEPDQTRQKKPGAVKRKRPRKRYGKLRARRRNVSVVEMVSEGR